MNNKTKEDNREFTRVDIHILATLKTRDKQTVSAGTHDISMKGMFVRSKTKWTLGTECEVQLTLEGQNPPVNLEVKGRVQRVTQEGMAILFTEVGLEAYEHLHNLVLFNTDDLEKTEQEFSNHLGLKKK